MTTMNDKLNGLELVGGKLVTLFLTYQEALEKCKSFPAGTHVKVTKDPNPDLNGEYTWDGEKLVKTTNNVLEKAKEQAKEEIDKAVEGVLDKDTILDMLDGEITGSMLDRRLEQRIERIPSISGDVDELKNEVNVINVELNSKLISLDWDLRDINNRIDEIGDAVGGDYDAIKEQIRILEDKVNEDFRILQEAIDQKFVDVDDLRRDLDKEVQDRITSIKAETDARVAEIKLLNDGLTKEIQERKDGDSKLLSNIENYKVSNDKALANVQQEVTVAVTEAQAATKAVTALDARLDVSEAESKQALTNSATALSKAEAAVTTANATATRVDALQVSVEKAQKDSTQALTNSATAVTDAKAAVDKANAVAQQQTILDARLNQKNATYRQDTAPNKTTHPNLATGDIWINPSKKNEQMRWDGTKWVDINDVRISDNATAISTMKVTVQDHEGRITAQGQKITNLETSVGGKADASALQKLEATVQIQEGKISNNTQAITALQGEIKDKASAKALSDLTTTVNEQGETITTQGQAITSVQAEVKGMDIGGQNLWSLWHKNLTQPQAGTAGGSYMKVDWLDEAEETYKATIIRTHTNYQHYFAGMMVKTDYPLIAGDEYVVTFEMRASKVASINQILAYNGALGTVVATGHSTSLDWVTVTLPMKANGNQTSGSYQLFGFTLVSSAGWALNDWYEVRRVQLQKGNKATRYNKAQAVLLDQLAANSQATTALTATVKTQGDTIVAQGQRMDGLKQEIDGKASSQALDQLKSTVTKQGNDIATNTTAITSLQGEIKGKADAKALTALETTVKQQGEDIATQSSAITSVSTRLGALDSNSLLPDYNLASPDDWIPHYANLKMADFMRTIVDGKVGNTVYRKIKSQQSAAWWYNNKPLPNDRKYRASAWIRRSPDTVGGTNVFTIMLGNIDGQWLTTRYSSVSMSAKVLGEWEYVSAVINMQGRTDVPQIKIGFAVGHNQSTTSEYTDLQGFKVVEIIGSGDIDETVASSSALTNLESTVNQQGTAIEAQAKAITGIETSVAGKADNKTVNELKNTVDVHDATIKSQATSITTIESNIALNAPELKLVGSQDALNTFSFKPNVGDGKGIINLVAEPSAVTGKVIRHGLNSSTADGGSNIGTNFVAIDPEKMYRVKYRYRRVAGEGTTYLALACANDTRTGTVNTSNGVGGIDSASNLNYFVSAAKPALNTWVTGEAFFKGKSTAGTTGVGTEASPYKFPARAAYFRIAYLANYLNVAGTLDIDYIIVEDFDAGTEARANAKAIQALDITQTNMAGEIRNQATAITKLQTDLDGKASNSALQTLDAKVTQQGNTIANQAQAITKVEGKIDTTTSTVEAMKQDNLVEPFAEKVNTGAAYLQVSIPLKKPITLKTGDKYTVRGKLSFEHNNVLASGTGIAIYLSGATRWFDKVFHQGNDQVFEMTTEVQSVHNDRPATSLDFFFLPSGTANASTKTTVHWAEVYKGDSVLGTAIAGKADASAVESLKTDLKATNDKITAQGESITKVDAKVDSLNFDWRNLQPNTRNYDLWERFGTAAGGNITKAPINTFRTDVTRYDRLVVTGASGARGIAATGRFQKVKIRAGNSYTISFLARGSFAPNYVYMMKGGVGTANAGMSGGVMSGQPAFNATTFTRMSFRYTAAAGSDTDEAYAMIAQNTGITATAWFEVAEVMVEEVKSGAQPTDWTPSYLDMSSIDESKFASAQAVSTLTGRVEKTERDIVAQSEALTQTNAKVDGKADTTALNALSSKVTDQGNAIDAQSKAITSVRSEVSDATRLAQMINNSKRTNADPMFEKGLDGMSVYASGATPRPNAVTRILKEEDNPTSSTHQIKVTVGKKGGLISLGGFYQLVYGKLNAKFVTKYLMKIPVGYTMGLRSNSLATGGTDVIVGSNEGTGKYEIYTRVTQYGGSGTAANHGHVYFDGVDDLNGIDIHVAQIETYCLSDFAEGSDFVLNGVKASSDAITKLETRTTTNETTIAKQGQDITKQGQDIAKNAADIKTNATAITGLSSRIDGKADAAALSKLETTVQQQGQNITTQGEALTQVEAKIDNIKLDRVTIPDTRATNQPPSWYWDNYPSSVVTEFKNSSALGLVVNDMGTYVSLETVVPFVNATGGNIKQVAQSPDFQKYQYRYSTGTGTWSPWKQYIKDLVDEQAAQAKAMTDLKSDVSLIDGKVQANASAITRVETEIPITMNQRLENSNVLGEKVAGVPKYPFASYLITGGMVTGKAYTLVYEAEFNKVAGTGTASFNPYFGGQQSLASYSESFSRQVKVERVVFNGGAPANTAVSFYIVGDNDTAAGTKIKSSAKVYWAALYDEHLSKPVMVWQPNNSSTSAKVEQSLESINGIQAQYTVKTDVKGYVAGIGLINEGVGKSAFIIRADQFAIAAPEGQGGADGSPKYGFIYQASPKTLPNGTVIPAGLYIDNLILSDVDARKINAQNLSAITATIGTLRTATSGSRMEIHDNVIKCFDGNTLRVQLGNLDL